MDFALRSSVVQKSDIDQLVVGYVAEERYFRTRNQLFDESPNLPEKVPILSIFGDVSSEHRLHRILDEYVQFKTKQLVPICAVCGQCQSLPDLWKIFDRIVEKIKNFKPADPPPPARPPEMQRYSPSHLLQQSSRARPSNTGSKDSTALQRKQLNPVSNQFEPMPSEGERTGRSTRRKKTYVPRKIKKPLFSQTEHPYAHTGDLSKLLHTSDKDDALALVGVKILSNMKKCAEKSGVNNGNSSNTDRVCSEDTSVLPLETSGAATLDIDDLISDETRGGLVEMTIDSLLNPEMKDANDKSSQCNKSFDEEFSELKKLLEFDDDNLLQLNLPDLIQSKQDEKELIDIIKADDELELPENPTPMDYGSSATDASLQICEQSEDMKSAVTELIPIQSSQSGDSLSTTAESTNITTGGFIGHEMPRITGVRSEVASCQDPQLSSAEVVKDTKAKETSKFESTIEVHTQAHDYADENELLSACATMPPKKRFLAKETFTPEKTQSNQIRANSTSSHKKRLQFDRNLNSPRLHESISSTESSGTKTPNADVALPSTSNVGEQSTSNINTVGPAQRVLKQADENGAKKMVVCDKQQKNTADVEIQQCRRSKRKSKANTESKDATNRQKIHSKKNDSGEVVEKKRRVSAGSEGKSLKSPSKYTKKPKRLSTSPNVRVVNPGEGKVVISLKNRGRMPIRVQGIVVHPKNKEVSKKDIIDELVGQMSQPNSSVCHKERSSTAFPAQNSETLLESVNVSTKNAPTAQIIHQENSTLACGAESSRQPLSLDKRVGAASKRHKSPPIPFQLMTQTTDLHPTYLPEVSKPPTLMTCGVINSHIIPNVNTPQKLPGEFDQFSTISPSAGIFSVMGYGTEAFPSPSKTSRVNSVKSNLSQTFMQDVYPSSSGDIGSCVKETLRSDERNAELSSFTASSCNDVHVEPSSIISNTLVLDPLLSKSGIPSGNATRQKAQVSSVETPKVLKQEKVEFEKRSLVKKRGTGIHMCNKMKNMVRIEPKRRGVPAVRRYIVETEEAEADGGTLTSDSLLRDSVMIQSKAEMEMVVENHLVHTSATKEHRLKENTTFCSSVLINKVHTSTTGSSNTSHKEVDNSSNIHTSTRNNEFDGVLDGGITSGTKIFTPEKKGSSNTDASANIVNSSQVDVFSPTNNELPKKLKKKSRKENIHKKKKKKRLAIAECSPVMKWSYKEIQAKLDSIHGERSGDGMLRKNQGSRDAETEITSPIKSPLKNGNIRKPRAGENVIFQAANLSLMDEAKNQCTFAQCRKKESSEEQDCDVASTGKGSEGFNSSVPNKDPMPNDEHPDRETQALQKECTKICKTDRLPSPSEKSNLKTKRKTSFEKQNNRIVEPGEADVRSHQKDHRSPELLCGRKSLTLKIEPLDLSLSSWANSNSHQENALPFSKGTLESNKSGEISLKTRKSEAKATPLCPVPDENVKQRRSRRKGKTSRKIIKLEKKIKKVNLKDLDISKFLASLDYTKVS